MQHHVLVEYFTGHQKAAGEVVAHHGLEAFAADHVQRGRKLATRIVNEVVDFAVCGQHIGHGFPDSVFFANVAAVQ